MLRRITAPSSPAPKWCTWSKPGGMRWTSRRSPARTGPGWAKATPPTSACTRLTGTTPTALRERVLWRLLYDTAARAEEILTLDIGDLDTEFRRARPPSQGGQPHDLQLAT